MASQNVPSYSKTLWQVLSHVFYEKKGFFFLAHKFSENKKKILDVACGEGKFIQLDPKRIVGIDHHPGTVAACKKKGYTVIQGDVLDMDLKEKFGAVHCSHIIEHLYPHEMLKLLEECDNVLEKDGLFMIGSPWIHDGFWGEPSHIRPYLPVALDEYLVSKRSQSTFASNIAHYRREFTAFRFKKFFGIPLLWRRTAYFVVYRKLE